jgi:hypothetical protein
MMMIPPIVGVPAFFFLLQAPNHELSLRLAYYAELNQFSPKNRGNNQ